MQNLKIQTLWQLCQELKQKRQTLIEKLSYTQTYLDEQQNLMSSELGSLRQQNNELSSDLAQLYSHLETLRHAVVQRRDDGSAETPLSLTPVQSSLQLLAMQYERLAGELTFGTLLAQALGTEQERWGELGGEFDPWYRRLHDLRNHPGEDEDDFLSESEMFLPEFRAAIEDARNDLAATLGNATEASNSPDQQDQNALLQAELETLRAQYENLQTELEDLDAGASQHQQTLLDQMGSEYRELQERLDQTQDFLSTKDTEVGVLLQTVQVIQREFDSLRENNQVLAGDLKGLEQQTDQLISLVETYRQVALAAASEAGMQAEVTAAPEATEAGFEADSSEAEGEEDEGSANKADAVREAVRKKLNTVLRHRFGKVPRKLSTAIKDISSSSKLDKLFDKALKAESLDEFEAGLEG